MHVVVSFVYQYLNNKNLGIKKIPCLLRINNKKINIFSYPKLSKPIDFRNNKQMVGQLPLSNKFFKINHRFGFTGLTKDETYYYAASYGSIYQIKKKDFSLKKIISNQLMSDIHGICIYKKKLFHVLTGLDTVVITNLDGRIIDFFSVTRKLKILRDQSILRYDWRFINKNHKGASGFYHINFISIKDNEIWLTSRNLNSFIVVNLKKNSCELRTMNLLTTSLIHDGIHFDKKIYLTSVNGKIIELSQNKKKQSKKIYNRDLIVKRVFDIDNNIIKGNTNWCRGIEITKNRIFVMIDGRYETRPEFSILELDKKKMNLINRFKINYKKINTKYKLKYLTGFSILEN